jgi:hypothetical protein
VHQTCISPSGVYVHMQTRDITRASRVSRAAMHALFLYLLAWWWQHDVIHLLGLFSFRK